jgi:hypothetical protein
MNADPCGSVYTTLFKEVVDHSVSRSELFLSYPGLIKNT